jgi:hypothetical protein
MDLVGQGGAALRSILGRVGLFARQHHFRQHPHSLHVGKVLIRRQRDVFDRQVRSDPLSHVLLPFDLLFLDVGQKAVKDKKNKDGRDWVNDWIHVPPERYFASR